MIRLALALLLLSAAPAFAARTNTAGFDTCSNTYEGGTSTSINTSTVRTGRCALNVAPASAASAYIDYTFSPLDTDLYGRFFVNLTTRPSLARPLAAMRTSSQVGCTVYLEPDGSLSLWYKDNTSTSYLTMGATSVLTSGWHLVEMHHANTSTSPCASNCIVTCTLSVDGVSLLGREDNVSGADFINGGVDRLRIGTSDTTAATYAVVVDDVATDDSTAIGYGKTVPLVPEADGTLSDWARNGCSAANEFDCVNDFASGTGVDDDDTTFEDSSTSGNKSDYLMTTYALVSNGLGAETIKAVTAFAIAREQSAGTRSLQVNIRDGTNTIAGTSQDTSDALTYGLVAKKLSTTAPDTGAWDQADLDALQLQPEKTSGGGNRITALLAYADIAMPNPAIAQNLQDWTGDGRITVAAFGDSRIAGTQSGVCSLDASVTCSTTNDCTAVSAGSCVGSSRWPTVLASLLNQSLAKTTTVLMCGINGNTMTSLNTRATTVLSGDTLAATDRKCVGGANNGATCANDTVCPSGQCGPVRYCRTNMPTRCLAASGCSGVLCQDSASECLNEGNGLSECSLSCSLVSGSKLCHGGSNAAADCTLDSECPSGMCADYPQPDYVLALADINDLHMTSDPACAFSGSSRPPCPPLASATPNSTPTPGNYHIPRVTCNNLTECQTGRCNNNFHRACDVDGDCTAGTCNTAAKMNAATGCVNICTTNTGVPCTVNASCPGTDTCSATKVCVASCAEVPCTTNDRADGTSSQCGPGVLRVASREAGYDLDLYGICSGGFCSQCGPPGNPGNTQYTFLRQSWNWQRVVQDMQTLATTVAAASRRMIWLIAPTFTESVTSIFGWGGTLEDMLRVREWQRTQANAIDLRTATKFGDPLATNKRCVKSASTVCATDADCPGTGNSCASYASVLRPSTDDVHMNDLGAIVIGNHTGDYMKAIHPVCSGDTTTSCGQCGSKGTPTPRVTTTPPYPTPLPTANCNVSSDCADFATGDKCRAQDHVCVQAGKGTCTAERTGKRCVLSLSTACTTDADCVATGGGACRDEGLLAEGQSAK